MRALHRLLILLLGLLLIRGASAAEVPELAREFRGAWVATVFNIDWPSKPGLPTSAQQAELRAILDRAAELHLNAILLQVRPSSDALYLSKLEPWSAFLTGASGRPPETPWDPLAWAITEAHARGLELHAWFNPFRGTTASGGSFAANHVSRTHPGWLRKYGGLSIVDPGEPAARDYVREVIMDVVRRYDVDGIHIDDYFYPYPSKGGALFPDGETYRRFAAGGGKLTIGDWRRDNINQFVEGLYRAIKAEKRWVKFGISPFGIWRPHVPETIVAGVDSYDQLYADSRRWLVEGWCDYLAPQLYWPIDPPAQSFPVLLNWWRAQSTAGRPVWPGLATTRIGSKMTASEIARQIALTREGAAASGAGQIHWDMKSLMSNQGGISSLLARQAYRETALVPATTWLASETPAAPKVERQGRFVRWRSVGAIPSRWWAVQARSQGQWSTRLWPDGTTTLTVPAEADAVAIRAIDRFGNASAATLEKL